jgi:hypothetical protein
MKTYYDEGCCCCGRINFTLDSSDYCHQCSVDCNDDQPCTISIEKPVIRHSETEAEVKILK